MRSLRRRYILFKYSGTIQEPGLLSYLKDRLNLRHAKIVLRKPPFFVLRIDHLSWESIRRDSGPRLIIISDTFHIESIVTSGTIRKIKEKIKALDAFSLHGDEEAVPVKSEGKDVE